MRLTYQIVHDRHGWHGRILDPEGQHLWWTRIFEDKHSAIGAIMVLGGVTHINGHPVVEGYTERIDTELVEE